MSKTKEELNELKEEVEKLDEKPHELTEEELAQVTGGVVVPQNAAFFIGTFGAPFYGVGDDKK